MIQLFKKKNNPTHPFRFDFPSLSNCFQLTYLQKPSLHMHINISICSAMKISFSQEPSIVLLSQYKMSKNDVYEIFFLQKNILHSELAYFLHHLLSSKPWKYSKKHLSDDKSWENFVQIGRQLHMSCIAFASCTLDNDVSKQKEKLNKSIPK